MIWYLARCWCVLPYCNSSWRSRTCAGRRAGGCHRWRLTPSLLLQEFLHCGQRATRLLFWRWKRRTIWSYILFTCDGYRRSIECGLETVSAAANDFSIIHVFADYFFQLLTSSLVYVMSEKRIKNSQFLRAQSSSSNILLCPTNSQKRKRYLQFYKTKAANYRFFSSLSLFVVENHKICLGENK